MISVLPLKSKEKRYSRRVVVNSFQEQYVCCLKWNRSYGKGQDVIHKWYMKQKKQQMNKWNKQIHRRRQIVRWLPDVKGVGRRMKRVEQVKYMVTADYTNAIYRWCNIKPYTENLYNVLNQCYPNKCNLFLKSVSVDANWINSPKFL